MPYLIHDRTYQTKQQVTDTCRAILNRHDLGAAVDPESMSLLLDLFRHPPEWDEKRGPGVVAIVIKMTDHRTRCFDLVRSDRTRCDISYLHAIKHLPSPRSGQQLPQTLIDFKNAARQAIADQIAAFKSRQGDYNGQTMHVDHAYPLTFDALLFSFCREHGVDPTRVPVIELNGCVAHMTDDSLRTQWTAFHAKHAMLRLVSKADNLTAPRAAVNWRSLCSASPPETT